MMLKKTLGLSVLLIAMGSVSVAHAVTQTVTLGYSQAWIKDLDRVDGKGLTAKYHYQGSAPVGVIGAATYMGASVKGINEDQNRVKLNFRYFSLLAGPSYKINDYVSIYGMTGVANGKIKVSFQSEKERYHQSESASKFGFAYGAGVQIVPAANWTIDTGYEGAHIGNVLVNGINFGVGYHF